MEGKENLPRSGPVILASNHVSFIDNFMIPLVVRGRKVTFVAKAEYFDSWKTAWFFRAAGQIPMPREGGSASERALLAAQGVLRHGGIVGIYPEGTRSPDGRLYKGHTGVARLALQENVPIIPVGVMGTREVQPKGAMFPRPFKTVRLVFSQPIPLDRFKGAHVEDPLVLRTITDELMFEIQSLTKQEYVNEYSKRHGVVGGYDAVQVAQTQPQIRTDLGSVNLGSSAQSFPVHSSTVPSSTANEPVA